MNHLALKLALIALLLAPGTAAFAQSATDDDLEEVIEEETVEPDDTIDDEALRLNPVLDIDINDADVDVPMPEFIRRDKNRIILNGANWDPLRRAIANSGQSPASIVLIGDSHLQAGFNSHVTRNLLQYDFGNAGRGLISPLKEVGTNQPDDFTFTIPGGNSTEKLMTRNWPFTMGFTGVSVRPHGNSGSLTVATSERDDWNPFRSVTIFHGGKLTITGVTAPSGADIPFRAIPSRDYTQVLLGGDYTDVTIAYTHPGDLTIYGASLSAETPGIFVHEIGNNGATYASYNRIGTVGPSLISLNPDLVVIMLGTNEAFGRLDPDNLYRSIDILVKNIQQSNPNAEILLVTPMECQKSVTKTVKKKVRRKGRRGRKGKWTTVNQKVKSYDTNPNIPRVRDEILRYGRENHVAVLDLYDVCGGRGASSTWLNRNLMGKDRLHLTARGYRVQGRILYDAIITALQQQ